jgi:putative transposase
MDVSLMARMKELEAENARLRKMYVEEKIKAEIVAEALAKNVCPPRHCKASVTDPTRVSLR